MKEMSQFEVGLLLWCLTSDERSKINRAVWSIRIRR